MAEKSTLIDKLPPVAKADSPAPTQTTPSSPPAKTVAKQATAKEVKAQILSTDSKSDEIVAVAGVAEQAPPAVTITGIQKITYYSFLGDAIIWGLIGLLLFGKAFKDKANVRYVSMATYGGLLAAVGFMFFINAKTYASFLQGSSAEPGLGLRGFAWAVFAPVIFYVISRLVKVPSQDKKLYVTMFGLASGLFLFIGLSQIVDGRMEQLGLSVFPFLFSASLTLLLFMTLGTGASALKGPLKKSATIIVFTIIGGWFIYPIINLLSHLTGNMTLFSLALNGLDLVMLSSLTFGLWAGMSTRTDIIMLKPSFGKARPSSGSPFPVSVSDRAGPAPSPAVNMMPDAELDSDKAKPSFKRPKAPTNVGNN